MRIIDSHNHWGASVSLGTHVSTAELLGQMERAGIGHAVILPFPSTAIMSNEINIRLLNEAGKREEFIPYFYIREDFPRIPPGYFGGKWHWMRGIQDTASNYDVLGDRELPGLISDLTETGKPIIFEEDLSFTEQFVRMAPGLPLIIPHLGMLGGSPLDFLKAFRDSPNVFFDTALAPSDTILRFFKAIGPERIIFGSDVPFGSMATELSKITSLPIAEGDKELILSENIIRLAKVLLYAPVSP